MGRFVNPGSGAFRAALNSKIYVDKTGLLEYTNSVLNSTNAYICNSRPRRFGKSITANMLTAYYSKGCNSSEMFEKLEIGRNPDFRRYLNQYDVIHFDVQWFITPDNNVSEIVNTIQNSVLEELKREYPDILKSDVTGLPDAMSVINEKTGNQFIVIIDEWDVLIRDESKNNKVLLGVLYSLYRYKRPIKVLADRFNMLSKIQLRTIRGIPLVDVTDNNFSPAEQNIKLFLDKVCSVVALLLLSPLFAYIAWRVKKDSPGPVFFRQERIGYLGQPFWMYKFRTMYVNAEENGPSLSSEDDLRVTPFGRIMRKYRLDELPQFWNVLKGDMSLVGPRPERKYFIDEIVKTAPYYYLLHNVRPGITSLGMVKYGYAASVDKMVERIEYDILYYENMSLTLDLTILIYTVKTVITGKGV